MKAYLRKLQTITCDDKNPYDPYPRNVLRTLQDPDPEEVPGANFIALDDCYIISNINRAIPSLVMAVGLVANHSFALAEPDYSSNYENDFENIKGETTLTDYFSPQTSIIFKIGKVSLAGYLAHNID